MIRQGVSLRDRRKPCLRVSTRRMFSSTIILLWGLWWKDHQWGYKCCKQSTRNSYCTGQAGIEAAQASAELMRTNIERKEALQEKPAEKAEKNLASWGSEVPDDVVLDKKKLKDALKKEEERLLEEKDDRKRKYNVTYSNDVSFKLPIF